MNRLEKLQTRKLFKELEYVESDFEYRNEIISEADSDFIIQVNNFLEKHPELKEIYDNKVERFIQNTILKNTEDVIELSNNTEEVVIYEPKLPKVRKLYREIVKLTHPDKIGKKKLNDLYLTATRYYDNNDKIGIYRVCTELNIDYELDTDDNQIIESKVEELKKRIQFIESTFAWQWVNTKSDRIKNEILIDYIRTRLK